jgi:hypothetical protein
MYNSRNRKKIKGWFSEIDARIFELLLRYQSEVGLVGSVAEIGLHHGKSFILLCSQIQDIEKAYGVDVFKAQHLNLDSSGLGNKEVLMKNLQKFDCNPEQIVLDGRESEKVMPEDIILAVDRIRFFSIDGGHWKSAVSNDLELAKATLRNGGIIALDDYLRSEWPEVTHAFHEWFEMNFENFSIIAIGFNKIYLTHVSWAEKYRAILEEDNFLIHMLNKYYKIRGNRIPIYTIFFLPEMGIKRRITNYFKMYHSSVYFHVKSKFLRL